MRSGTRARRRRRGHGIWPALALAFALDAHTVRAAPAGSPPATAATAPWVHRPTVPGAPALWRDVRQPAHRRVRSLLRQAQAHVELAQRAAPGDWRTLCARLRAKHLAPDSPARTGRGRLDALSVLLRAALTRTAHLDNALRRLDRAQRLLPRDPEVLQALANALSQWEQPGPPHRCTVQRRDREAIAVLRLLRAVVDDRAGATLETQLGGLLARVGDLPGAVDAYRRAVDRTLDADALPAVETQLAAVYMRMGELSRALTVYERAAAHSRDRGPGYLVALFGQAVAIDRLGDHPAAVRRAQQAVAIAGGSLAVLRSPQVGFEPTFDRHYSEALGHEARMAHRPEDADLAREAAIDSWQDYLREAPADGPFRLAAEANLARLLQDRGAWGRELSPLGVGQRGARTTSALTLP